MSNENIKSYLEILLSQKKYDEEFIKLLIASYIGGEDDTVTAEKILGLIDKKYVENKRNKN